MNSNRSPNKSPKDAETSKGLLPGTYHSDGATQMQYHVQKRNAKTELAYRRGGVGEVILSDTIGQLIWAQRHRDFLLCYAKSELKGREYFELRKFIRKDDTWIPTPKGCTMPPEAFSAYLEAINAFAAGDQAKPCE